MKRGPLREITGCEALEGYEGVYVETQECGHMHIRYSDTPTPRSGQRHCLDCRDGTDHRTERARRYMEIGPPPGERDPECDELLEGGVRCGKLHGHGGECAPSTRPKKWA